MASKTDAITLLKEDHREVEELFKQFEKASGEKKKQEIAQKICKDLTMHAIVEEEIFYPACEGAVEEDLLKEGYVEHDAAKILIAEIEAGDPSEEFYDAKMKVLKEEIEHHVKEEEKQADSMFKQAKKADLDLEKLGEEITARKEELKKQIEAEGLPKPQLRTMEEAQV